MEKATLIIGTFLLRLPKLHLKRYDTNDLTYKQKQNHRLMRMSLWLLGSGKGRRERIVREFGMDMYTLLSLKWITNKDLLCSTWNSAQCYVAAWMGGELRGEWIHVYCMAESLCCPPVTITTLLISCIPIQNKKFKKKKNKTYCYYVEEI